jgi:phenylacetate-CoA ligase
MLTVPMTPLDEWTARRIGAQRVARAALARWQRDRLHEVVAWARGHSPFYRRLYAHLSTFGPEDHWSTVDLPFVETSDLREHGLDMVCVSLGDIARVVTIPTSGSTGPPKRLWFTEEDLELTIDHFRHGMRALVEPGNRVLVLMPGATPGSVGALLHLALARDAVDTEAYGFVDTCEGVTRRIMEYGADCLVGVPSQVLRLARSREGRTIPHGRIRSVLLSGDHVSASLRAAIEQAWGCDVFEHYGSTETGLGGAVQCRAFAGLHVREADLLCEVIDPCSGSPLPDGEEGELVVTTLTRRGMPLIRYRTGDAARLSPDTCACGSMLRCLSRLQGRLEDTVGLGGETILTMAELDQVTYAFDWLTGFNAVVTGDTRDSEIVLRLAVRETPSAEALGDLVSSVAAIPSIRNRGVGVRADVEGTGAGLVMPAKRRIEDTRIAV